MVKVILAGAIAAALFAVPAANAQTPTPQTPAAAPASKKKAEKTLSPQQQKMKDCGGKWQEYKKANNVKGNAEYRKFLKTCLKG